MQVYTVSQVTAYIRNLFDNDPELQDVWVEGEISNYSQATSGHVYFTLKDAYAQLRCVVWRSQIALLEHVPCDGDAVIVHGRASVYEPHGRYQLYVDKVRPLGAGALFLQFEALKERLQKEGLFAADRKRPLPRFPRKLGVVTSPVGAAIRDILNILRRRYPLAEVILAPTAVQGDEAPPQIVAAIKALNAHSDVEAIIVARGGGSLEELWAFNDERVARAIFASRVPVISGIGHETDFTIADLVADVRAPTPSAAAEIAVPDQRALQTQLQQYRGSLRRQMVQVLSDKAGALQRAMTLLRRFSPQIVLERRRQDLDERQERLLTQQRHRLAMWRQRLSGMELRLRALSPLATLERGYAVVSRRDTAEVVRHRSQVQSGDSVDIRVSDGSLGAKIE